MGEPAHPARRGFVAAVASLGAATLLVIGGLLVPDLVARSRAERARAALRVGMSRAEVLDAVRPLGAEVSGCDGCSALRLEFRCWAYAYALQVYFGPDGKAAQAGPVTPLVE